MLSTRERIVRDAVITGGIEWMEVKASLDGTDVVDTVKSRKSLRAWTRWRSQLELANLLPVGATILLGIYEILFRQNTLFGGRFLFLLVFLDSSFAFL